MWIALLWAQMAVAVDVDLTVETEGVTIASETRTRMRRNLASMLAVYDHTLGLSIPDVVKVNVRVIGQYPPLFPLLVP